MNMDVDEDLPPLSLEVLEQLLIPATAEDDGEPAKDELVYGDLHGESFRNKLREYLSTVTESDPLVTAMPCKPCLPNIQGEPFTIQQIPGRGMGVVATRWIPRGSIILSDPFAISIQEPTGDPFPEYESNGLLGYMLLQLLEQYVQLPLAKRKQLAGLHPHLEPGARAWFQQQLSLAGGADVVSQQDLGFVTRLYYTFNTNEFSKTEPGRCGMWTVRRLFLLTARINHSCCPNARSRQTTDGYKVVTAIRDIEVGEEVLLKYLDPVRFTRQEWQATTQRTWGFVCNCEGCESKTESHG
ncbi:unnamed protein product [Discula destructiva]